MNGETEREVVRGAILAACKKAPEWSKLPPETSASYVRKLERSCYNDAVLSCIRDGLDRQFGSGNTPFIMRYQANCYRLLANLDSASIVYNHVKSQITTDATTTLIQKICSGEVSADNIMTLTSYDMCPSASQAERDEINLRKNQRIEQKVSRQFTCRKCNDNRTISQDTVTRAADEAVAQSVKCINCGYSWICY